MNANRSIMHSCVRLLACVALASAIFAAAAPASARPPTLIYVDWSATGANTGTSWKDAYPGLQSAFVNAPLGSIVWVAQGTYKPAGLYGTNRTYTFTLRNHVAVYGGFDGTETEWDQRDPRANLTILSGELYDTSVITDNSFHVVTGSGTDKTAVLDGFTITGGNANGAYPYNRGGGVYIEGGSPTLENLVISNNTAGFGGGLANLKGSSPSLTNVTFRANTAALGGGMANEGGDGSCNPSLIDVVFSDNSATGGGGVYNYKCSPGLKDVTFSDNFAKSSGGALLNDTGSSPSLFGVIINNNTAGDNGGGISNSNGSSPVLVNVTLDQNVATNGGGIHNSLESNANLSGVTISNNLSVSGGGMYNSSSKPILSNVTFSANKASYGGGMFNFNTSNPFLVNVTFSGNTGTHYGGAMMNNTNSGPVIKDSIFWGNSSELYNGSGMPLIDDSIVAGGCPYGSSCTNVLDANPLLGGLANNDGPTDTMALGAGSAAIDAGNNATCAFTDQRGISRPQGLRCDMGAFEWIP